jgi:hypothetical protein
MNVDLARVQFAFTSINHFFFIPAPIGFLSPKITGGMHQRSRQLARRIAPVTCTLVIGFAIWTHVTHTSTFFAGPNSRPHRGRPRHRANAAGGDT